MKVKRQKPKPKPEEVWRQCPTCGAAMSFAEEDEVSVTLRCHGWNYRDFGSKAQLWRTLHRHGVPLLHDWDPVKGEVLESVPSAQRG